MIARLIGLALATLMPGAALAQQPVATGEEVEAAGPLGPLRGTLLTGGKSAPVAVMIPGSGPTDRDGNNPLGVKAASLRMLAEALAARGVSTIRIDKRGMFGSKGAVVSANDVRIADYVADVGQWIALARARTGARCVWLIGHSEGGMVALATVQSHRDVCGVVLVASLGRPMVGVMREQIAKNPANAPLMPQIAPILDSIEAGKVADVTGLHPALLSIFAPDIQRYLIDASRYDPAKLIAAYRGPALIVQGARDLQTTMADADAMKAGKPAAALQVFPDMNHVLKDVPADPAANLAAYGDPALPLAAGLANAVAAFIKR